MKALANVITGGIGP